MRISLIFISSLLPLEKFRLILMSRTMVQIFPHRLSMALAHWSVTGFVAAGFLIAQGDGGFPALTRLGRGPPPSGAAYNSEPASGEDHFSTSHGINVLDN